MLKKLAEKDANSPILKNTGAEFNLLYYFSLCSYLASNKYLKLNLIALITNLLYVKYF